MRSWRLLAIFSAIWLLAGRTAGADPVDDRFRITGYLCAFLAAVLLLSLPAYPRGTRDAAALQAMADLADGREGVVCWQSRRTGPLRIFCCDFDGADLRQVSPDVSSKDHIAPLISPDGTRVLYYQTTTLTDSTYYNDHTGDMMIVDTSDTNGSSAKRLVSEVRTYAEFRFVRWIDSDQIAYIGSNHHGYVYSISQDQSSKIFDYPYSEFGALPNRQLTHAVDGDNLVFTINNPGPGGTLTEEQDYDGCQGNMSNDGLWAYRVKGGWPGHHFNRMRLGSWEEEMFFENLNSALPLDQNYQYFPQLSPCQQFLGLGASRDRDEHAHWDSDYDIFVVPIDPSTFLKTGDGVKYSFSNATDSYPDIWVGEKVQPEEDGARPDGDGGADDAADGAEEEAPADEGAEEAPADEGEEAGPSGDDSGDAQPEEADEEIVVYGSCKGCHHSAPGQNAALALLPVLYWRRCSRNGGG